MSAEYRLRLPSEESLLAEMAKVEAEVDERENATPKRETLVQGDKQ